MSWIDGIPFPLLVVVALLLGLAPFRPEPHLWEKLKMLGAGTLVRPIAIFDSEWPPEGVGRKITALMSASLRNACLGFAVIFALAAGALSDFLPTTCLDDCAGQADRCGDCACCAPARAPVVLAQPDGAFLQTSSTHETLDPVRPSRFEERDVFHVPRQHA